MSSPQVVLITGANQGLGYLAALQLSKLPGHHVLLGARDPAKGTAAVDKIAAEGEPSKVSLLVIDVSSDESIEKAAAEVAQKFGRLDVLVVSIQRRHQNKDLR
jgi:NAD(P)-dependent dehydrogenase (short-subunit alcohol dehydrogenase family)